MRSAGADGFRVTNILKTFYFLFFFICVYIFFWLKIIVLWIFVTLVGTELFHQVHRWVNLERILAPCLIGRVSQIFQQFWHVIVTVCFQMLLTLLRLNVRLSTTNARLKNVTNIWKHTVFYSVENPRYRSIY